MKLIHLSDLHIGKRVNEFSMIEDQKYILNQILEIIREEEPDAVLIAGDIYDKSVPSAEAVEVFDDFLVSLAEAELPVFLISGNHDSAERLSFGGRILEKSRIHVSPVYHGETAPVTLRDSWGPVRVFLLPFVKPSQVRAFFPDREIETYTDAVAAAVESMDVDEKERNVLITHQFVTGSVRCESEELSVGGTDNVDAGVFEAFDYVALGHLHGPQSAGKETVRYCGSPLKYSFSEVRHQKSVTVLELREKGQVTVKTRPLTPRRDLEEIRGNYMEVTDRSFYETLDTDRYFHIILTDEEDLPDAVGKLRSIYPNLMRLSYDNRRTRGDRAPGELRPAGQKKSPLDLFSDLYRMQNNRELSPRQAEFMKTLIEEIWEEG